MDVRRLRDAPRLERIEAVGRLPDLIKALEAKATELAEQAKKRAKDIKQLAADLEPIGHE